MYVIYIWSEVIEKYGEVIVVFFDILKVFDRVWYDSFIGKFFVYGFFVDLCRWIVDFLRDWLI